MKVLTVRSGPIEWEATYQNPKAFAYCQTVNDGRTISNIVEKDVISDNPSEDPLVVGSFGFAERRILSISRNMLLRIILMLMVSIISLTV